MDKVGPIARSAKDCALVFDVIRGTDGRDPSIVDDSFNYGKDPKKLKGAYLKSEYEERRGDRTNDSLSIVNLRSLGIELHEVEISDEVPVYPLTIILASEAAAAFDLLTRSNRDSLLVRQDKGAWPNYFRTSRFIPAVDYVNAGWLERSCEVNYMAEQRSASQRLQHLGQAGMHTLALTGSENDDGKRHGPSRFD